MLDVLQIEKRYFVFDKNTLHHFISKCNGLGRYTVERSNRLNIVDLYYDSPAELLEKNNLLLRKRVIGSKAIIRIKRKFVQAQFFYSDNIRRHEREKEVNASDALSEHFLFLNTALQSMFSTQLKIDTDHIFKNLGVILTIKTKQQNYKLFGSMGLKAEIRHQRIFVNNLKTKRKNKTELIEIKMISSDNTLPYFEDFIKRIEKHCKEIFYTKDSKYDMALRLTQPLPTKEEKKMLAQKKKEESQKEKFE